MPAVSSPRLTVLFDLDGTLVHSAPDVNHAINTVFEAEGLPAFTVEETRPYLGKGARVLVEQMVHGAGFQRSADDLDRITRTFLDVYAANPVVDSFVYPGVFAVLERLRREEALLAVCTNKPQITARPVLDRLALADWFDAVVSGDQVSNRKPHGEHVLAAIAACGGERTGAVMVGDSDNDINAANHAGVPSVAVSYGYSSIPPDDLGADVVIGSFDRLPATLATITGRR